MVISSEGASGSVYALSGGFIGCRLNQTPPPVLLSNGVQTVGGWESTSPPCGSLLALGRVMNTAMSTVETRGRVAAALMGVGVLMVPAGFLHWYFYHVFVNFGWRDWIYVFSAMLYFASSAATQRASSSKVLSWTAVIGFVYQLFVLAVKLSPDRSLNRMRDGSIFLVPVIGLLCWLVRIEMKRWEASLGLPLLPWKTSMKVSACAVGITVSSFTLLVVFLHQSIVAELHVYGMSNEFFHQLIQEARLCSVASVVSASILTFSIMSARSCMKERWRQIDAAKQAKETKREE